MTLDDRIDAMYARLRGLDPDNEVGIEVAERIIRDMQYQRAQQMSKQLREEMPLKTGEWNRVIARANEILLRENKAKKCRQPKD